MMNQIVAKDTFTDKYMCIKINVSKQLKRFSECITSFKCIVSHS